MLETKQLQLKFGATTSDLNLTLKPKTITWLRGKNGAGKSTLLHTLMGFTPAKSGSVTCDGVTVNSKNPAATAAFFAYAQQKPDFAFGLSVARVLELGKVDLSASISESLGLQKIADQEVTKLSGGEAQRVLLALALSSNAPYVLLDEPFASQDADSIRKIKELIEQQRQAGRCFLVASHIQVEADQELVLV